MRLKEARKAARMTQTEVSKILGVNQNTYSYWENEKTKIDNVSLAKLAEIYNVSIDYLLDIAPQPIKGVRIPIYGSVPAGIPLDGNLFNPITLYNDLYRWLKHHHNITMHSLRHTYATRLLAEGIDVQTVAALLGDNVQTVINTYIHYSDSMRAAAAKNIEKIFCENF